MARADREQSLGNVKVAQWRESLRGSGFYRPIWRRRLRKLINEPNRYPDWAKLLSNHLTQWHDARQSAKGPKVAIATSLGLQFAANTIDTVLAAALTFRGAEVEFIYCDGALPACQILDNGFVPSRSRISQHGAAADICDICISAGRACKDPLGLKTHYLSKFLNGTDERLCDQFVADAILNVGRDSADPRTIHAKAGALRFFGRETLRQDPESMAIFRQYLIAAWRADQAARKIFAKHDFDVVVAHHGIYVPQGLIADVAREHNVRLVTWHPAYRKGRFIYQHGDTYHRAMISEPVSAWRQSRLTVEQDAALTNYLSSRETGSQDWIKFQREGPDAFDDIHGKLGLDRNKDVYLLAANVAWDARLHYPSSAFGTMFEWVAETIRWFKGNPKKQLIIRCHPGEVTNIPQAQDRLDLMISSQFPNLPKNIRVIPAESRMNTYALGEIAKVILIYNTKMGMEMSARGKPVFVAGDAWIRGKGFSRDASSPKEYRALLGNDENAIALREHEISLARQYAYHFFFRRCIPFDILDPGVDWPFTSVKSDLVETLLNNRDDGLDVVCKGVMDASPFEYNTPSK